MTSEREVLSPEVEGILRELARDPSSTLLRVPRPSSPASLFAGERRFDPGRTGLNAAERELVRVHREEIARLLRQAATHRLISDPNPRYHITRFVSPTQRRAPLDRRVFDGEARHLNPLSRDVAGHAVFDALLGADVSKWPSVLELSTLAQRFVATDQGRILAGIALVTTDQPKLALPILLEVAHRRATGPLAANAWTNAGFAYIGLVDRELAHDSQETAARLEETSGANDINWLINALLIDKTDSADRAARRITQRFPESCASLDEQVEIQHPLIRILGRSTTFPALSLGRKLADRWSASPRKVLRVFEP